MDGTPARDGRLREFLARHAQVFVLTGAGCSTASGIPDYRDADGAWKHAPPITYQAFMAEPLTRARYWARSLVGWRSFGRAQPNAAHYALAELERQGKLTALVTQNVDGLHQRAGSRNVVDLHGRLDVVRCMACPWRGPRDAFQHTLEARNPDWVGLAARIRPDGDAELDGMDFSTFQIPPCPHCGGIVKPDVVYYGEGVPRERVERATAALDRAEAMLVVGSSLMVYSGFRFVRAAVAAGKPVVAVNHGHTRADDLLTLKIDAPCEEALAFVLPVPVPH